MSKAIAIVALLTAAIAANAQTFTTLFNFNRANGNSPNPLVEGPDGNFYGTASSGGPDNSCYLGCGTYFQITPEGQSDNSV